MNPLDIFSIGFSSDSLKAFNDKLKQTKKNLDETEKEINALEQEEEKLNKANLKETAAYKEISKRLDEAQKKAKQFSDEIKIMEGRSEFQLQKLRQNFMKTVKTLGAIAIVSATVKKSLDMYEQAEQLGNLAQKADIAVESLQKLGLAAARYGGDTETSANTVQTLKSKETKEKALKYGINLSGDSEQALENIARKMETLKTDAQKLELANTLGLDEGTTRMLMQGVANYREELKRTEKYKMYTKEDIERMRDYRQIQTDIRMGVDSIYRSLSSMLLPAITGVAKVVRGVTDWLAEHEGAVKIVGTFVAIVAGIGLLIGGIMALNAALQLLWANPVGLIILAVAAYIAFITTVINDFVVFLQGGESVIGSILEKLGYDSDAIRKDVIAGIEKIKSFFTSLVEKIRNGASTIKKILTDLWNGIPEPVKKMFGLIGKGLMMASPVTGSIALAGKALEKYKKNPVNSVPAGSIQNYETAVANNNSRQSNTQTMIDSKQSKVTNIGTLNVHTQATNGAEVANDIEEISQFDNGIRA